MKNAIITMIVKMSSNVEQTIVQLFLDWNQVQIAVKNQLSYFHFMKILVLSQLDITLHLANPSLTLEIHLVFQGMFLQLQ